ncbi:MAG: MFS transporter [Candidatus Bathyarchaeota archaeon]|nr:MFS transporter [Candidatus Bathyarchaeota archaeon]
MSSLSRYLALEGNIRVLALQTLISQLGFGMLVVVWQPYMLSAGLTVVDLGLIQSVINFSTAAGLFIWGPLSDIFGRKRVMLLGHASRVVAVLALVVSGNPIFLYVFAFFIGFSALWMQANPARTALLAESVPNEKRATAYGTLMAISQGTNMVMASIGGYLAIVTGYWPIFAITVVGEVIGIAIMLLFIKETHHTAGANGREVGSRIIQNLKPEREMMPIYVMLVMMGIGYGVGYSLFYGALTDTYKFTTLELGLMSTATSLAWALGSIPSGKLSERFSPRVMVMISTAASLITVVGFILFRSFPAFLVFSVFNGLDPCFWIPNWTSIIADRVPVKVRSSIFGKMDAYNRFAAIPAPYIGGLLYAGYGFTAPLLVHLAFVLVWGYMLIRITAKPKAAT